MTNGDKVAMIGLTKFTFLQLIKISIGIAKKQLSPNLQYVR